MKKIKSVAIYKPTDTAVFSLGSEIIRGVDEKGKEIKTGQIVDKISISIYNNVDVILSDKSVLCFRGFPISYEV